MKEPEKRQTGEEFQLEDWKNEKGSETVVRKTYEILPPQEQFTETLN